MKRPDFNKKRLLLAGLLLFLAQPLFLLGCGAVNLSSDWRTANRESVGIAPKPEAHPEALVQVYAARAFNWRGLFAVHTWIAFKPKNAKQYTVAQVVGWRLRRNLPVVKVEPDLPDRRWYDADPVVIDQLCGAAAEAAIPKILTAASSYPFPMVYRVWPGPNSNTFIAHIIREVPELTTDLPPTAIGKDFLPVGEIFGKPPAGPGAQLSLGGFLGVLVGEEEGVEVNLFGASFGVDVKPLGVKLPFYGRLGIDAEPCGPGVVKKNQDLSTGSN